MATLLLFKFAVRTNMGAMVGHRLFFEREGRRTAVTCVEARDGNEMHSFTGDDFSWLGYGEDKTIVISEPASPQDQTIMTLKLGNPITGFDGGIVIPSKYAIILIAFEITTFDPENTAEQSAAVEWAKALAYDFVAAYRWYSDDPYLPSYDPSARKQ